VREVTLQTGAAFYLEGYHRPSYLAPDDAVYDAISDILSKAAPRASIARWCAISRSPPSPPVLAASPATSTATCSLFMLCPSRSHYGEMQKAIHVEIES